MPDKTRRARTAKPPSKAKKAQPQGRSASSSKAPLSARIPTAARRPTLPKVVDSLQMMQATSMGLRAQGKTVGFVPTMGALHDGHIALLREARQRADVVVASVFVNPLQFGPSEDFSRYPRDLERDRALCATAGVDIVFAPQPRDMYPEGFETHVRGGALSQILEGEIRPGHFDGVLTVVGLLFHVVQPHFAVFGEKDYQQLALIRRMVRDLRFPVEIVPVPVIRDVDGLALSSRNVYLQEGDRRAATCLYRALMAAQDAAQSGEREADRLVACARAVLDLTPEMQADYVELRDPTTLKPLSRLDRPGRLLLAGRIGQPRPVRLIDNGPIFPISW